jgi:hypothetical protein
MDRRLETALEPLSGRYLGSLSNRALLVNDAFLGDALLGLYAGIRVVSAVGTEPPHDGPSRVRPARVSCAVRIGRNHNGAVVE